MCVQEPNAHQVFLAIDSIAILIKTTIQVSISLVVTSDKINACSVYTQQAYLRAAHVSMVSRPRDQLNAKDADVTSLPN